MYIIKLVTVDTIADVLPNQFLIDVGDEDTLMAIFFRV